MSPFRDSQGSSPLSFSLAHLAHMHATPGQEAHGTNSQATRLSTRGDCSPPRTHLVMSGDIFRCHNLAGRRILRGLVLKVRDLLGTAPPHKCELHDSGARQGSPAPGRAGSPFQMRVGGFLSDACAPVPRALARYGHQHVC